MALVMQIENITDTDCTFDGYDGWINIDGMSFGVTRSTWDKQLRSLAASDTYEPIMELILEEALVSSLSNGAGSESISNSESVSFNFTAIEWVFYPQKEDGTKEGQVAAGYDIKQGKKSA
jgi:type VI protein secretion system component Hcp